MPPVILWMLGAVGATVLAKWVAKETRRINGELDTVKAATVSEAVEPRNLKRDPESGVYRPH
jgi:hypothetical protein